ncbi:MAG: adenylyltransferase/cytidyltransferase family protein [bacterium]|nr:adenylyltransferase/cytidyltransferase family protein [bacterium]
MKKPLKTVMAFGTFDLLHPGHKYFLSQAKKLGDYLIVVIARNKTVKKVKGKLPEHNEKQRQGAVMSLNLADKVILGDREAEKYGIIKKYRPEIICLGYDQKYFVDGLNELFKKIKLNTEIIRLKPFKPELYKTSIINMEKITKHSTIGAIIKQGDKILMVDRKNIPLGWACVAGHIETGETPEQTLIKEVKEEADLNVKKFKLLIHEFVPFGTCGRGFTGHDWYIYEVLNYEGEVKLSSEHKAIGWKTVAEINKLQLEEVWEYFFKKLKIIF